MLENLKDNQHLILSNNVFVIKMGELKPIIGKNLTMISIKPYEKGLKILYFDEKVKEHRERSFQYSQFEDLTEKMALKCFKDCYFYKNYYEDFDDNTIIMKICRNKKIYNVYFDKVDFDKVDMCKWNIQIDQRDGRIYVRNMKYGFLQRHLMTDEKFDFNKQDIIIDHINRNTLDNRRSSNLRIVDNSLNQKNKSIQKNNTSGIPGVNYNPKINSWVCRWNDFDKKRHTKTFSILKYGENEAKTMAIELRKEMEKKYGYIG